MLKLFIPFVLLSATAAAQSRVVEISSVKDPNEVSICIDNKNPNRLLVGANIFSLYHSVDGGISWKRKEQSSPYGVWGDPVIVQDTTGSFYHFHLSNVPGGSWIDRIVCQRSDDGGLSFSEGTFFGLNSTKAQDKPWAVVNPYNNEIYVTWTQFDKYGSKDPQYRSNIMFSRSADRGETWQPAKQINSVDGDCEDDDETVEGAVPAIGPKGEIYVAWSGPNGLVFNRSFDNGDNWEENELSISELPGGWNIDIDGIYRANGMPVTKCDLSEGAHRGTIYVNWVDKRNGHYDVFLSKSTDHGSSWSDPVKVNQDVTESDQFFTWMDIDQTNGNLWFVYYDRRNQDDLGTDVFIAVSSDGGETFKEEMISASPFYPNAEVFFGDYNNIAAHRNVIRPVWTRLDEKELSIKTALIDPYPILGDQNSIDLIVSCQDEKLLLEHSLGGKVVLMVYDLAGNFVGQKPLKTKSGMSKTKAFEDLQKGTYWVELKNENGTAKGQWIKD